jgi:hypothetical protein
MSEYYSKEGLAILLRFARKNDGPWDDVDDDLGLPHETEAAKLAAAHEMYDSLRDAVRVLEDQSAVGTMLERFKATLAKARGE